MRPAAITRRSTTTPGAALPDRRARAPPQPARRPRHGQALQPPAGAAQHAVRPELDPANPTMVERGLVGYFLCGDLETQWEFVQKVWVNQDLATPACAARASRSAAPARGRRDLHHPTADARDPIVLRGLPNLVRRAEARTACCRASAGCASSLRCTDPNGGRHERDDRRPGWRTSFVPCSRRPDPSTVPGRLLAWWGEPTSPRAPRARR